MAHAAASIPQVRSATASPWCHSGAKRCFDLFGGSVLLLAALPLMLLIALLVRLTSPGPMLFRQRRVGRAGEITLLKFRTMRHSLMPAGPRVTQKGDRRITPVGRFLRAWKLDELPQLINVVRGDMSLVGPRPDLPEYLAELPPRLRELTTLRPGLTGWATLRYRNEEEVLANVPAEKLKEFYVRVLMPRKARLDLTYGKRSTWWSDIRLLWQTALAVLR